MSKEKRKQVGVLEAMQEETARAHKRVSRLSEMLDRQVRECRSLREDFTYLKHYSKVGVDWYTTLLCIVISVGASILISARLGSDSTPPETPIEQVEAEK